MQFPRYRFTGGGLQIAHLGSLGASDARALAEAIFFTWHPDQSASPSFPSEYIDVDGELRLRTEGASDAEVYDLTFRSRSGLTIARFIIKAHLGDGGREAAERERLILDRLVATGSEWFSATTLTGDAIPRHMVVYRHVRDQLGVEPEDLHTVVGRILRTRDTEAVSRVGEQIGKLIAGVTRAYDEVAPDTFLSNTSQVAERHRRRLIPDLVIDARNREIEPALDAHVIVTADGNTPAKLHEIPETDFEKVCDSLVGAGLTGKKWLRFVLRPESASSAAGLLRFGPVGSNRSLWLRVDAEVSMSRFTNASGPVTLLVNRDDCPPQLGSEALEACGFEDGLALTADFFQAVLLEDGRVTERFRHTDLHAGNVLWGDGRPKVIDLISSDRDLPSVSHARLEASLWRTIAANLELTAEDMSAILSSLAAAEVIPFDEARWNLWAVTSLLGPLRTTLQLDAVAGEREPALAYSLQLALLQRYLLEREDNAPLGLVALAKFWRNALENDKPADPSPLQRESNDTGRTSERTLGTLWQVALSEQGEPLGARASRLMEAMKQQRPELMSSTLTELQDVVYQSHETRGVFGSENHIIVSGPTGSGKSTVGEMFLARPAVVNDRRARSLYIAPTRALAQAKHRDLLTLFAQDPELRAGCLLSTGEDTDHDWRIVHGKFSIACMVYEKANILFSRNRQLFYELGCVVVDEMHMLSDLERGPILELVLTKLVRSRQLEEGQTTRAPERETLQIIVISTEDSPDAAFSAFLSTLDEDGRRRAPAFLHADARPLSVSHYVVLPGRDGDSYTVHRFAEFSANRARSLSKEDFRAIDKELDAVWTTLDVPELLSRAVRERRQDVRARAIDLIADLFQARPSGFRILVFVPGRAIAEELAKQFKNKLTEVSRTQVLPDVDPYILHAIKPLLDDSEDSALKDAIRRCAAEAVYIHHADVHRRVRQELETGWSRQLGHFRTEVIFSTETLSYGVNLGINDVVILGTQFRTQSRMREPREEALSACAFHNMTGRAGRLGHASASPGVYIIVGSEERPTSVIRKYYSGAAPAKSRLFVSDDKQALLRVAQDRFAKAKIDTPTPCGPYASLGPLDFSYPFVRSVLDALRHLNLEAAPRASSGVRTPISKERLLQFFNYSTYAHQVLDAKDADDQEATFFSCAVERILDGCSASPLHLVQASQAATRLYAITDRGEAIIDTGTELSTVEPLLRIVTSVRSLWPPDASVPSEVFLLCLLGQEEIFRHYIRYAPECRKSDKRGWTKEVASRNRAHVLSDLEAALAKLAVHGASAKASAIRRLLDAWEPLRAIDAVYTNGASDAVIRFFCATVAWVMGEKQSEVFEQVEIVVGSNEYRGRLQGWRQLTEMLAWKALFLAKMLGTAKAEEVPYTVRDEREVLSLAARLRLGCTAEAVPLFWPQSSNISRRDAVALLSAGMKPSKIVTLAEPQRTLEAAVKLKPTSLDALRRDLERYAMKEFEELAAELTPERPGDARSRVLQHLWRATGDGLANSIDGFRGHRKDCVDYDIVLRESFNAQRWDDTADSLYLILSGNQKARVDAGYRLRVEVATDDIGVSLVGEGITDGRAKRRQQVRLIGVQMRRDWSCHVRNGEWISFARLLADLSSAKHVALVVLPWTPFQGEIPKEVSAELERRRASSNTLTLLTAAAFCVTMSALLRDFTEGQEVMTLLAGRGDANWNFVNLARTQATLQAASVAWPELIREKIVSHFEVDPLAGAEAARASGPLAT